MKRTLALFLTLSMLVTLCMTGCGKKEEAPAPEAGGAPQEETVTIATDGAYSSEKNRNNHLSLQMGKSLRSPLRILYG